MRHVTVHEGYVSKDELFYDFRCNGFEKNLLDCRVSISNVKCTIVSITCDTGKLYKQFYKMSISGSKPQSLVSAIKCFKITQCIQLRITYIPLSWIAIMFAFDDEKTTKRCGMPFCFTMILMWPALTIIWVSYPFEWHVRESNFCILRFILKSDP